MTSLLIFARIWAVRIVYHAASLLPVRERVVLATSHKARIDGNLACIRDELAARYPSVRHVVLAHRPRRGLAGLFLAVANELIAARYLATSRLFVVDDYFFPIYVVRPRRGTKVVQTWHACGALKKFGYSLAGKSFGAPDALVSRVAIHSNYDVCLASSPSAAHCLAEAFRLPIERFVTDLGIPRTDLLVGPERMAASSAEVRRRYRIPDGRRIILYAPTFRGNSVMDAREPPVLELGLMRRALGHDHVVLLRQHPFVRSEGIEPGLAGFVIDVSDHPEINELMLVSDLLITDYSSVIFEFALLGRPIVLFAPDRAAYELERGFYFDYRADGPGPVFEATAPLAEYLRAGQFDLARVERFRAHWLEVADGRSTARFVDRIILPALAAQSGWPASRTL